MILTDVHRWRELGALLRQWRLKAQASRIELAEWLGCDEERIVLAETSPDRCQLVFLIELAWALDHDPTEILEAFYAIFKDRCSA